MKRALLLFLSTWLFAFSINAQVIINEIRPDGTVELKNTGNSTVNVAEYWLCNFPAYQQILNSNIICGETMLEAGEILAVDDFNTIDGIDGELGLYTTNSFGSADAILDYVEWGSTGHQRSAVAVAAGIWSTGDFVNAFQNEQSLAFDGEGDTSSDWAATANPSICEDNEMDECPSEGGTLSTADGMTEITICAGDGISDAFDVTLTGNSGSNSAWVITDDALNILALPDAPPFDLEGAGPGVCLVWYLSFEAGLEGAMVGANAGNLSGCFDLSNPITVTRNGVNGGNLTTADGMTELTICAGDGASDAFDISLTDTEGTNSAWVITDQNLNILGLPAAPPFDLEGAGNGVCLVWHLSFEDGLEGAMVGANAGDLSGCFDLSNPITVTRNGVNGGNLTTADGMTELTICAGDGASDAFDISLTDTEGTNSAWVITDQNLNILGLPAAPPFDLEGAGNGVCLVWHLSFEDGLEGAMVGANAGDLSGCFDLSNPITVTRNGVNGGNLTTAGGNTQKTICAGDGESDAFDVVLTGTEGTNSAWVITDDNLNILALPAAPPFDLEGAGTGVCLVWHLSFEDGLEGATVGANAANLSGCFDLSNPIEVTRVSGDDCADICDVEGGILEGGPFEFCVGDGVEDNVSGITLAGNSGENSQWVVTDDQGNILGLPPMPGVVNFDGAGPGTCLIWHLSYDGEISGLMMGENANNLEGCFDLSNPIEVIRNQPEGGTLEGGPFEFCVGDGVEDNVSGITLAGNSGENSQWIVTDDQGNILGLPPMPGVVNFDGAGPGTCLIWHLSYDGEISGLMMGENANNLEGCFDLSNPIEVIRNQPEGGTLEGGPFEFCVGDGVEDNVSGITLAGNSGENSQWVVTDDQGNILGLPPMPGVVNFDGAGPGTCLIWHLSYDGEISGLMMGENANNLEGCFDLSNPIEVIRNQPEGGTLEGGPFEFCVGDGVEDNVSGITLAGNSGENSQWVVTDDQGNILGLPPMPGVVNFDGAGPGTCLIWHLSYDGEISGLMMGENANDLEGCFDLSNPIEVIRNQPEGGTLEGGPFEFCVGDGVEDNVSGITLAGNSGENSQWIVTDDQGNILGLPPMPGVVNFDGAGPGTCLIWHLSYDGEISGLMMGENANDLEGCFDLSNPIEVIRNQPEGGTLEGGPFEFCVGDGVEDNVSGITLAGNSGENSQWIVTDDQGNILGLPPMPGVVNFDGAGPGTCLIWHLSYDGEISGLMMGENANDLEGCFDLSNPIEVIRNQPEGGNLTTADGMTELTICAGDGDSDEFDVSLSDNSGTNSAWVITDADLNILALPPAPPFDLEGAGPGVCLIWHLSFEDGLEGATVGANAADLSGCFDLSNPITVTRLTGEECGVLNTVDLELSISSDLSAYTQYENISYFITVTNEGNITATNVVIAAGLPDGLVYTSDDPSQGSYNLFFEEWTIDELAGGASATLELELFPLIDNVEVSNFVEVIAQDQDDVDSTPGNGTGTPNEDDEALLVVGPETIDPVGGTDADLSLEISVDDPTYEIYTNVIYTVTITNNGPDAAANIAVAAGLPDGMVYTAHSTGTGVYNLFFEEWQIPLLESGASATLELVLFTLVDDQAINNFVEVTASDQNDPDSTPDNGNGISAQEDDEAAISVSPFFNLNNGSVQSFQTNSTVTEVQSLNLFPVPATDEINIRWTANQEDFVEISVFDINGKVLHLKEVNAFKGTNTQRIDTQELAEGIYFVQLRQNEAVLSQRFQKITN